jgi:hypothetical protein
MPGMNWMTMIIVMCLRYVGDLASPCQLNTNGLLETGLSDSPHRA